jgi:hypothetical protein
LLAGDVVDLDGTVLRSPRQLEHGAKGVLAALGYSHR